MKLSVSNGMKQWVYRFASPLRKSWFQRQFFSVMKSSPEVSFSSNRTNEFFLGYRFEGLKKFVCWHIFLSYSNAIIFRYVVLWFCIFENQVFCFQTPLIQNLGTFFLKPGILIALFFEILLDSGINFFGIIFEHKIP